MTADAFRRLRVGLVLLLFLGTAGLLFWRWSHGGIPVHHVLRRGELPGLSTAWDPLVLPLLAWVLSGRVRRRLLGDPSQARGVALGFALALALSITLSLAFSLGLESLPPKLVNGVVLLALFLPIYRAECVLGWVVGGVVTFGALLPTAFATLLAGLGFLLFHLTRLLGRGLRWGFRRNRA